jgi:hypothetical protein
MFSALQVANQVSLALRSLLSNALQQRSGKPHDRREAPAMSALTRRQVWRHDQVYPSAASLFATESGH